MSNLIIHKIKARYANNIITKSIGLIGKNPEPLFFKTRFGIHSFGIRNDLDILILDKHHKVVNIELLKPNRFLFWNIKFNNVLELPKGTVKRLDLKLGDQINLNFSAK